MASSVFVPSFYSDHILVTTTSTKQTSGFDMGSEGRRHYDIAMSKRTRRSFYIKNGQMASDWEKDSFLVLTDPPENEEEVNVGGDGEKDDVNALSDKGQILVGVDSPKKEVPENLEWTCKHELTLRVGDTEEKREGKRFEELINGEKEVKTGRSSLEQHFTKEEKEKEKEKQMQVVVRKQKQEGAEGLKFKGLVRRYAKVLGHLIKNKHEPRKGSRNKPLLQLTM